ncbi:MAG TPA: hypothetical protein VE821_02190, partial [Pyrinomonadaceae bacterium]|nr:hypothetical protein [Pyrinomonadaceae bacterium]
SLRRWVLATRDAHKLYARFGFTELTQADRWMEKFDPQQGNSLNDDMIDADASAKGLTHA